MATGSIVAGIAAFLLMIGGAVLALLPVAGSILSFLAPVVAVAGIILGGLAISRANQQGLSTTSATVGVVLSSISFVFGLGVALTCGLCNACMTAQVLSGEGGWQRDGSVIRFGPVPSQQQRPRDGGVPRQQATPEAGQGLPPPPLAPGPAVPKPTEPPPEDESQ